MKMFIRNVAAGTCGWLGNSRGRAAGEIEHGAAAVGPAALRSQRRQCRLQEIEEEEKERGAAAVDRALQSQRRQYQFREAEEVKGDGVRLTGTMLET